MKKNIILLLALLMSAYSAVKSSETLSSMQTEPTVSETTVAETAVPEVNTPGWNRQFDRARPTPLPLKSYTLSASPTPSV